MTAPLISLCVFLSSYCFPFLLVTQILTPVSAQTSTQSALVSSLSPQSLAEFYGLSKTRQTRIQTALEVAQQAAQKPYHFGGSSPQTGFDCSGAIYYVLRLCGYQPPRTSSQQYLWLKNTQCLIPLTDQERTSTALLLKKLTPGDLVFWGGTYSPTDGRTTRVTHVAMYLGTELRDQRPVMICASKGRRYRGHKGDGFGVFDFKVPSQQSKAYIIAIGRLPKDTP